MDVSIIIVNYNTKETTKQCIDSIVEKTKGVKYEIILVDNDSVDGSKALFSVDNRIVFVESNSNLGFGKANNLGFAKAKGKYIFLLNSDTIIVNDAVSILYDKMEHADANVACIGSYLYNREMNPNQSFGRYLTISRCLKGCVMTYAKRLFPVSSVELWGKFEDYMDVEMIIGADLFIRRQVIEKYGMFNPSFFMYHEENDMQRRFSKNGYKNQLVKGPKIIHLENVSSSNMSSMKKKIMGETGMFTYMRIWNKKYAYVMFKYAFLLLKFPILFDKKYSFSDKVNYLKFISRQ